MVFSESSPFPLNDTDPPTRRLSNKNTKRYTGDPIADCLWCIQVAWSLICGEHGSCWSNHCNIDRAYSHSYVWFCAFWGFDPPHFKQQDPSRRVTSRDQVWSRNHVFRIRDVPPELNERETSSTRIRHSLSLHWIGIGMAMPIVCLVNRSRTKWLSFCLCWRRMWSSMPV